MYALKKTFCFMLKTVCEFCLYRQKISQFWCHLGYDHICDACENRALNENIFIFCNFRQALFDCWDQ